MKATQNIGQVEVTSENGSTYKTVSVEVKGSIFNIMQVSGRFNYLNVCKITNNPYRTCGKDFADFNQAAASYKSADMKVALIIVESQFKVTK